MTGRSPQAEHWTRRFLFALAIYFLLQTAVRILLSGNAELDEAEQILLSQQLSWGYGSQPPLYTWMQAAFFSLFGEGIPALALLKNILLFNLYLFTFLTAREMSGEEEPAIAAATSLLFIPQIAWEAQRDLTHSVLATTLAAASLYALARLCRRGGTVDYLAFGFCAGLGILGKYNFLVFLSALLLAVFSIPPLRRSIHRPRFLLALLVLGLVIGGHLLWVFRNTDELLRQAGTFHREALPSIWLDYTRGGSALTWATLSFAGPLVAVYLLLSLRPPNHSGAAEALPFRPMLARSLVAGLLICVLLVLAFRVTNFKDRWMQPILFAAAIYLPLLLRPRLNARTLRRLLAVGSAVALSVLLLLPARVLLSEKRQKPAQLNAPVRELAQQLRAGGFTAGTLVVGDRWLGGNLRLYFPDSAVIVPELPFPPLPVFGDRLIVWDASMKPEMPASVETICRNLPGCTTSGQPSYLASPFRYDRRTMRIGVLKSRRSCTHGREMVK